MKDWHVKAFHRGIVEVYKRDSETGNFYPLRSFSTYANAMRFIYSTYSRSGGSHGTAAVGEIQKQMG